MERGRLFFVHRRGLLERWTEEAFSLYMREGLLERVQRGEFFLVHKRGLGGYRVLSAQRV